MNPRPSNGRGSSLFCAALLSACGATRTQEGPEVPPAQTAPQEQGVPAKLLPAGRIGYSFQWRQRVTATWRGGQRSFDAVLSRDGDLLQLLGLGPMGKVGFILRARDGRPIEVEHHPSVTFAFDPRYVLVDVQRAFYPWIKGVPPQNGQRTAELDGESIVEVWQNGALQVREFHRLQDPKDRGIRIAYSKTAPNTDVAGQTVLTNDRLGYTLEIETLSQTRLTP
jgi:hypothetical protein